MCTFERYAVRRVALEQRVDEVARGGRELVGHLVFGLADALECALDAGHLER